MKIEKETIKCEAVFSDDRKNRYSWRRIWDKEKPTACVIMLNPCMADTIICDTTTYLVVNNIARLETFGGVEIVNLFSRVTNKLNFKWNAINELTDETNDEYIKKAASEANVIILAWGRGAASNRHIAERSVEVINLIKDYNDKTYLISSGEDSGFHPLTPSIRNGWILTKLKDTNTQTHKEDNS